MNFDDLQQLITYWKDKTYLSSYSFQCPEEYLQKALYVFQSDYNRWYSGSVDIDQLNLTPQLQAVLLYRIANSIYKLRNDKLADLYSLLGRIIGQIEIYYSAEIGPGIKINHGIGSVIGARVCIGPNFTIHQNCTIGDKNGGRPVIEDNVTMYAGSMVLGAIRIGSNSVIGANSVVMNDFPENSLLVGFPATNRK